jgi:anhydro-N-acetylmuramic acid kinase
LHRAAAGLLLSHELGQLHHDLGRFYAAQARGRTRPDAVGLHGQTVYHHPDRRAPATLQIGEPAYLAEALGVPVVSNFRAADMAAGGQGAPLATMFHRLVFARRGEAVCVNNIGGISNVTALDWRRGAEPKVMAFDTGPGNMLVDMAMSHFSGGQRRMDRNGALAARGQPDERLLGRWLRHPYFRQPPPKSTGRELFGEPFFARVVKELRGLPLGDAIATLTELTARSLAVNYRLHLGFIPDEIILTGGGANNPALVAAIGRQLPGVTIQSCQSFGWPPQSIEPAAFALLAALRLEGKPGNLPATTGARHAVLLGQICESPRPGGAVKGVQL